MTGPSAIRIELTIDEQTSITGTLDFISRTLLAGGMEARLVQGGPRAIERIILGAYPMKRWIVARRPYDKDQTEQMPSPLECLTFPVSGIEVPVRIVWGQPWLLAIEGVRL